MVERSLSMREVPGSIPGASNSKLFVLWNLKIIIEAVFAEHHFHCKVNFLSNSICMDEIYPNTLSVENIHCGVNFLPNSICLRMWRKYIRTRGL